MKRVFWISLATAAAIMIVMLVGNACILQRSVRLAPVDGLRVLEATSRTELRRLPWSTGPVPQRYELTGPGYRVVFETPDNAAPYGLFIETAQAGTEQAFIEGERVHRNDSG